MDALWTEGEVREFLGQRIKNVYKEKGEEPHLINGIPKEMPEILSSINLESERVREAIQACASAEGGDIVLITGPGGSGKSALFRAVAHSVDNALCITPTGIAALNLVMDGWNDEIQCNDEKFRVMTPQTINKALSLIPKDYYRIKDAVRNSTLKEGVSHVMVDEISMVNPNMLDLLIYKARKLNLPLLLFGDPLQLPPVEKDRSGSKAAMYKTWRFFGSFGWMLQKENKLKCVILDSVYRQNDPEFKALLNRARVQNLSEHDKSILKSRVTEKEPSPDILILCYRNITAHKINEEKAGKYKPTLTCSMKYKEIFGHNPFADMIDVKWREDVFSSEEMYPKNTDELSVLAPRSFYAPDMFEWVVDEDVGFETKKLNKNSNVEELLHLYPGDRVMITRNTYVHFVPDDFASDLYSYITGQSATCLFPIEEDEKVNTMYVVNGNMGTYLGKANGFTEGCVVREKFDQDGRDTWTRNMYINKAKKILEEYSSENLVIKLDGGKLILLGKIHFEAKETDRKGEEKTREKAQQYPLKHAFAITYHKSQGLSLDKVHMILDPEDVMPSGLGYLGLSRCRTLEGLSMNTFVEEAFTCDKVSRNFIRRLELLNNIPSLEERERLVGIVDVNYEEPEPIYQIDGSEHKFKSVKRALEVSEFLESASISQSELADIAQMTEEEWHFYRSIYSENEMGVFIIPNNNNEKSNGVLWNLNRQKLHFHPELSRLLHFSGEKGENREAMAKKIVDGVGECYFPSVLSFMCLKNPKPDESKFLIREEYNRNALESALRRQ